MNIITFKKLCIKSCTKKADEIHDYYLNLEELLLKFINEESSELKQQLSIKEKQLQETQQQLELKTKLKVKKWYNQEPGHVIYGYTSNENELITVGKTKNIKMRESNYMTHNQTGDMFYIKKCYNSDLVEKVIHHILDKHRVENNREWFDISKELAIYTINLVCSFLDRFVDCSEKLPEFKITELIDNLNLIDLNTTIEIKTNTLIVPNIIYNNKLEDYDKFVEELCDVDDEYFSLPYELISAYRIWCKGDLNQEYQKKFLNYIQNNIDI